jgi:8-oxo-dGTP diphosphatase
MEAVAGIVFNASHTHVLLIQRRDIPVWVLPGGGIEEGELPEQAVCREIAEESGCQVEIVRKIAQYEPRNKLAQRTHFYECRIVGGHLSTGAESRGVQFYPIHQLPLLPPPYPYWIRDALQNSRHVLQKEVEGVSYWILIKLLLQHPILVARFLLTRLGIHINSKD